MHPDNTHHSGFGMLENMTMVRPEPFVERHQTDVDRLFRPDQDGVSPKTLIPRFPIAGDEPKNWPYRCMGCIQSLGHVQAAKNSSCQTSSKTNLR